MCLRGPTALLDYRVARGDEEGASRLSLTQQCIAMRFRFCKNVFKCSCDYVCVCVCGTREVAHSDLAPPFRRTWIHSRAVHNSPRASHLA